jgi:hypothetical protein
LGNWSMQTPPLFFVDSTSFFSMITFPWSNQDVSLLVHFSGEISVTPLYFFSMYNNSVKFSWWSPNATLSVDQLGYYISILPLLAIC